MNNFIAKHFEHSQKAPEHSKTMSTGTSRGSSATRATSVNDSEASSGFKSFWKRSGSNSQQQNVTFVQQDPSNKKKTNRFSRLLRSDSTASAQDDAEGNGLNSAQKRRQQVYQAQKRHRNRKAEYVNTLEAEVSRLQHLDAMINSEKNTLAHQNRAMRKLLESQSLDYHLDSMSLSGLTHSGSDISQLGGASVDIRFDPDVGHERTFLDFSDMDAMWFSSETSGEESDEKPFVPGDSWAALDFILALEWPCRDHVKHAAINPDAKIPEACATTGIHGHALTATATVYQSSLPASEVQVGHSHSHEPGAHGLHPSSQENWQLPHSEIDKLVELSELLELDDESLTPAQAYKAIRDNVPNEKFLRPTLETLKKPLGSLVTCQGFGACMDAEMFWQNLNAAIESLRFTRPELE